MTVNKSTGRASSMFAGVATGTMFSLIITFLLAAALAQLIDAELIVWEHSGYWIILLLFLSAFLGTRISLSRVKRQRLLVCFLSGMVYFLSLLSISALFFGGQFQAVGVTAFLIWGASCTAGLLGTIHSKGKRRQKYNHHYR